MSSSPDHLSSRNQCNHPNLTTVQGTPGIVEVTHHPDGSNVMQLPANGSIQRDANGNFQLYFPTLKRVEIADITAVVSHQINRVLNSTSHVIHFIGGGCFTIAYDQNGTLLQSQSTKIVCSFTDDGMVRLERSLLETERNRAFYGGKEL